MIISAKLDLKPFERTLKRLDEKTRTTTLRRSMHRARDAMRAQAVREVRSELNLKAGDARRAITRRYAPGGGVEIGLRARPIPLIKYGARQTRRGVSVQIKRRSGRKRLPSAFIAEMPSGHRGVFGRDLKRQVKRTKAKGYHGLRISELFSSAPAQAVASDPAKQRILARGREQFTKEMGRQIARAMRP